MSTAVHLSQRAASSPLGNIIPFKYARPLQPDWLIAAFIWLSIYAIAVPTQAQTVAGESVNASLAYFDRARMVEADKLIDEAISAGKCPGAVLLVGRGDAILYEKAYGHRALKPQPTTMTIDTVFDLASLTKPVATAISIMRLSEQGKLKIDAPVATYLPAFAANGKEKITVGDLLLHIGGLMPDDDLADFADGPAGAMKKILAAAPIYPPRSRFAYSDMGYIVLGELARQLDGRSLEVSTRDDIYRPLRMFDTGYLPPEALRLRCAPTQERNKHWMIGEVHDPRAYAMGGVAGHAGVFSTAEDLSRFCRLIVSGGMVDGVRVLKESTVAEMITPRPVPGASGGYRAYGFDVDTAYSSLRGDRFERGRTLGHTGFTGTAFWIDPVNHSYYILLTNAVHPDGKGKVLALRHAVATVVGEALLGPGLPPQNSGTSVPSVKAKPDKPQSSAGHKSSSETPSSRSTPACPLRGPIKNEFGDKFQSALVDKMMRNAGATKVFDAATDYAGHHPRGKRRSPDSGLLGKNTFSIRKIPL